MSLAANKSTRFQDRDKERKAQETRKLSENFRKNAALAIALLPTLPFSCMSEAIAQ